MNSVPPFFTNRNTEKKDSSESNSALESKEGLAMHKVIMEGRRCAVGEMQEEYLAIHTDYLNDPKVNRFILSRPPFTIEQQRQWLQSRRRAGDQVLAVLVHRTEDDAGQLSFVGVIDLRIDREKRTAESASVIGDKRYWRKGIAREARLMQLKLAFDNLGLRWIFSKTIRPNLSSQRLLESTGYQRIGVRPKARLVEGQLHDEFLYRVSRTLWLPNWKRYCEEE